VPNRADACSVAADLRAIVECLLAAQYSEDEILDYLVGPLGTTEREAYLALEAAGGPSRFR
jgi:hypothetical protein